MKFNFENRNIITKNPKAYLYFVFSDDKSLQKRIREIEKELKTEIISNSIEGFDGKVKQTRTIHTKNRIIILAGLGKSSAVTLETVRITTAVAARTANRQKMSHIAVEIPANIPNLNLIPEIARAQTESVLLSMYSFKKYITSGEKINAVKEITFFTSINQNSSVTKQIINGIKNGSIIGEAVNLARDLGNEPSNVLFPVSFAKIIQERGKLKKYSVTVLGKKEIEKHKMGCVIAVSKGSRHEPKFVIMNYKGSTANVKPVVLVGKGVTFDSGGISIKPSSGMEEMKMDMCGAAAVTGIFDAVAGMKMKINLVGIIPMVENMPGGNALKPGDIIKAMNGLTVEIDNTDAEGRLILADALVYAKKFNPEYVLDLATLTGAAVVVTGFLASVIMGNDDKMISDLKEAGFRTYDRAWDLPLWEEYDRFIDSDNADMSNTGIPRQAGTIAGGVFLKKFVKDYKWVHIDIAGTAMIKTATDYNPKYATGSGVRLVTQYLMSKFGQ